jgi:2-amino-4-hydroxy-6-hydroxymethyldihydropteridine diphosphokinase
MLKKRLDKDNIQIIKHTFPQRFASKGGFRATLGIGGNIGDVCRRFERLLLYLHRSTFLSVYQTSPLLQNPAFGYKAQKDFINAIIEIETMLQPKALLAYLLRVEKHFGRKRSFPNAPRTLDIDILFYENITMKTAKLTLPHHGWQERNSVLIPLLAMQKKG